MPQAPLAPSRNRDHSIRVKEEIIQTSLCGDDGRAARIVTLKDGRSVALRVARPDDISGVQQFVRGLSDRSRRNRFFAPVRELSPDQLVRVTRSRPPNELALVGETTEGAESRIVAMAQYAICGLLDAELAVVIDDAWQRQGLGIQLLGVLIERAARAGLAALAGFVLADNWPMLALLARLDCELITDCDPYAIRAVKHLDAHEFAVDTSPSNRVAPGTVPTPTVSADGIGHVGARAASLSAGARRGTLPWV